MQLNLLSGSVKRRFGEPAKVCKELSLCGAKGEKIAFQAVLGGPFHHAEVKSSIAWEADLFFEKTVDIRVPSSPYTEPGLYPDVMVPASLAPSFGDDCGGQEGALWCFLTVPRTAAAGFYETVLSVKADEGEASACIKIEVLDFELPEQNHNVTAFALREDMIRGTAAEKAEKYRALETEHNKYGLSVMQLGCNLQTTAEITAAAARKTADPRVAAYAIPFKTFRQDTVFEKNQECLDLAFLRGVLTALIDGSSDETDLLKKAYFYITFIDEPMPDKFHGVRRVYQEIHDCKRSLARELDFTGKSKVKHSLLTLDNVVTTFIKEPVYGEVDAFCPTFWGYSKPEYVYEAQKLSLLGKKQWWYGCVAPWTPFPNLHTDSPMRDSRYESWLRFWFGIEGHLYWATNLTKKYVPDVGYVDCDVLQETMFFPEANGDGMLFYTETPYGAPLASMRVFSMFLGLQEYEYFYLTEQAALRAERLYGKKMDARKMLAPVFRQISVGAMLARDFDAEELRREAGGHTVFAMNRIFAFAESENGENKLFVYSPQEAVIRCNGKKLAEGVYGAGKVTAFVFDGNAACKAEIVAQIGGKILRLVKTVSPRREWADGTAVKPLSGKIELNRLPQGVTVFAPAFLSEEAPKLFVPLPCDCTSAENIDLNVKSFCSAPFVLAAALVDGNGKRYACGYAVAPENTQSALSVGITKRTQNRLNSVDDAVPCKHVAQNAAIAAAFDFSRVTGIELTIQNYIKLLDENRERVRADYTFLLQDVSVTFGEK